MVDLRAETDSFISALVWVDDLKLSLLPAAWDGPDIAEGGRRVLELAQTSHMNVTNCVRRGILSTR